MLSVDPVVGAMQVIAPTESDLSDPGLEIQPREEIVSAGDNVSPEKRNQESSSYDPSQTLTDFFWFYRIRSLCGSGRWCDLQ
mgnify:CR=1 FL=1